jgi:recombination protein RecA
MTDKLALFKNAGAAIKKRKLHVHQVQLDASKPVPHLSTGNLFADYVIGGNVCPGFPRGMIVELFGPESSGKTTFVTQVAAHAVRQRLTVLYLDYEHAFSARYAQRLGLDIKSDYFVMYQPIVYEEAGWYVKEYLKAQVDLIIIDSLAAMTPRKIMDATDFDKDVRIGEHARLTSQLLQRMTAWQRAFKAGSCFVWVNQIRSKIDTSGAGRSGEKTTGGNALRFYAGARLRLQPIGTQKVEWEDPVTKMKKRIPDAITVRLENIKNKVADRQGFSDLLTLKFGRGFDVLSTAIDVAIRHKRIKKKSSWYSMDDDKGNQLFRVQGKGNVYEHVASDQALRDDLIQRVRDLLVEADKAFVEAKKGLDVVEAPIDDEFDEFANAEYEEASPYEDEWAEEEDEDAA